MKIKAMILFIVFLAAYFFIEVNPSAVEKVQSINWGVSSAHAMF
jgi:hypothetical protein